MIQRVDLHFSLIFSVCSHNKDVNKIVALEFKCGIVENGRQKGEVFMNYREIEEKVKELPIEDVIGRYIELEQRGGNFLGLCPFHPDSRLGSFVVTPAKGIWHCFTDNIGGDAIRFVMMYRHRNMVDTKINETDFKRYIQEAVYEIAVSFGIVAKADVPTTFEIETQKREYSGNETKFKQKKTYHREQVAVDEEIISIVYEAFAASLPLRAKDQKHLIQERQVPKENLKDFFRLTSSMNWRTFAANVFDRAADKLFGKTVDECSDTELKTLKPYADQVRDMICHVPGFWMEHNCLHYYNYEQGIAFLVRNQKGHAVGIQIRRDTVKDGESRYIWFSSAFALTRKDLQGGGTSHAQGGIIYPQQARATASVCITEGRFKAEAIARKGNIAIYVSGVSNWKPILPYLSNLADGTSVYLMFDSDLMGNPSVHHSLLQLSEALKNAGFSPAVTLWEIQHGKGFDDLVYKEGLRYIDYLHTFQMSDFEQLYQKALQSVLTSMNLTSFREIHDEAVRKEFTEALQDEVENLTCRKKKRAIVKIRRQNTEKRNYKKMSVAQNLPILSDKKITTVRDAVSIARPYLSGLNQEAICVLLLNADMLAIDFKMVAISNQTHCTTSAKDLLAPAISVNAERMIIFHNHPYGKAVPSNEDIIFTDTIKRAAEALSISVTHILIAGNHYNIV